MKKQILIPLVILGFMAIVGATVLTGKALAATGSRNDDMVSKLAQELNLDQTKVQAAFDKIHQERQAERQAEMSSNLDKAVKDGVITAEQKQKILDKMASKEPGPGEKGEMRQWATDNGIDFTKLKDYGFGKGSGNGRGQFGQNK